MRKRDRQAYILILPSLFTTGNLFCGFYAILRSFEHDFLRAAVAIMLAGVFDALDGRVARMTRSQTKFGFEYDSISDVVSFGLAPALLAYIFALRPYGRLGWVAAFFFAACGALRLARFNTLSDELPKSYFIGLPIPAAANIVSTATIAALHLRWEIPKIVSVLVMFGLGLLMVSNVRYRSFKDFDVGHRRRFMQLVGILAFGALLLVKWEIALLGVGLFYAAWGPVRELVSYLNRHLLRRKEDKALPSVRETGRS